jgi:hypothetical protein
MNLPGITPPRELPAGSAWIPAITVRIAGFVLGVLLSVVEHGLGGWMVVGVLFSFIAAWEPRTMIGWLLILFFAVGQISHHDTLDWQLLVMLAGLHLLHVLSSLELELPWRSWVSPAVLLTPLLRFVLIQIPCQLLAVAAMLLLEPGSGGHRPLDTTVVAVIGVAALLGLAMLLLAPQNNDA